MGRKTWDSLPLKFRPLPGRLNVVVTRQSDWQAQGAQSAPSLQDALAQCVDAPDAWVIGGAQIYAQALPLAHSVVVTEIDLQVDGDAFAPELDAAWRESSRESHVSAKGLAYSFVNYQRTMPL
jgi:dihydrofolate reductase